MKKVVKNKRAQIWIETVVYTLIAFVILGAVLSFAKPKIEELQDKSIIEQSIKMLENIDSVIEDIKTVSGNKRQIELGIKKGSLTIDAVEDKIIFNIESLHTYSEPGIPYNKGDIVIYNDKIGKINKIDATISYTEYNIIWAGEDKLELLAASSTPYKIFISNEGKDPITDKTIINFKFA